MVSLMDATRRAISAPRVFSAERSVVPRVVSMTIVSKWPAGNLAPGSVRWFSKRTSPVKKIERCLWRISTAAAPATWPAGCSMTSISSFMPLNFLTCPNGIPVRRLEILSISSCVKRG